MSSSATVLNVASPGIFSAGFPLGMDEASRLSRFDVGDGGEAGDDHDDAELETRKVVVDRKFSQLLKRIRDTKAPLRDFSSVPFLGGPEETGRNDDIHRSSDDDGNTEDLDDFSGLDDLNLSDDDEFEKDGTIGLKRKKPKDRDYAPNGRRARGYHKWAGKTVALLSTGEVGVIVRKPGGRIKVRLDGMPNMEVSSSEEKLHLVESSGQEAINEIYEAARYVPQLKDLRIGQRVAMTRFENATGRVVKLPAERRAVNGLGHAVVQLDIGGEAKKAVIESLRLLDETHPVIAYAPPNNKALGRPTKAVVASKAPPPNIVPLMPPSKRSDDWRRSLKAPSGLTSASPLSSPSRGTSDDDLEDTEENRADRDRGNSGEPVLVKRIKKVDRRPIPGRPALTRGQKLCQSCHAVIGTACRTCTFCNYPCQKKKA